MRITPKLASVKFQKPGYRVHKTKACVFILLLLGGCAGLNLGEIYGPEGVQDRRAESVVEGQVDYWQSVKPVLENRCIVCHACYDAPCQLKLTAIEGLERGAHKDSVYHLTRIGPAQPSRLFEDAETVQQWRDKGFFPVLNERSKTPVANREAGTMYRLLTLKEQNPLPAEKLLPDTYTLGTGREESCTRSEDFDEFAAEHPLWGMPYALPGLEKSQQETLKLWLEQGANYTPRANLSLPYVEQIHRWEAFLNQDSLKGQLASRYLYEHLFLAHFHFGGRNPVFFKMVRSSTPPGKPHARIATRRPYDDPGIERVYYRLVLDAESVVVKTHMPYLLDANRLQRWQNLFFDTDYSVVTLPGYETAQAANPFAAFAQIPVHTRYSFLLDEAQFSLMNFIKGPVCRGQIALNVIQDHFWIFFVNPDRANEKVLSDFFITHGSSMEMPNVRGDTLHPMTNWVRYSNKQKQQLALKDQYMLDNLSGPGSLGLNLIWDGDQKNENAALTVFRHFDSATVEKGLVGAPPQTAWLIDYSILERIHYLLVAGYDVYGNLGHQFLSRIYMDFLRMEAEANFLALLPGATRQAERANWYREADPKLLEFISNPSFEKRVEPSISYKTEDPKGELYRLIAARLGGALSQRRSLSGLNDKSLIAALEKLSDFKGEQTNLLPEVSLIEISGAGSSNFVTLIRNNGHLNITSMFGETKTLNPSDNTLTVARGFVGAYPNVFMKVPRRDIDDFVSSVTSLHSSDDYSALLDKFGVRRTAENFWQHSDSVHQALKADNVTEYGLLDYNRLDNR